MDKEKCMLDARIMQAQGYTQMQIVQLLGVTDRTMRTYLKERPCADSCEPDVRVSFIIPARNEEKNLPRLLTSLKAQKYRPYEVIVIDDCSEDNTASIAEDFGVTLFQVGQKPETWLGKSYACHLGASQASGDVLLFLDADCYFEGDGLESVVEAYRTGNGVLSIWPFHSTKNAYETLSLFFNCIVATNGNRRPCPRDKTSNVLYGPVFLVSRKDYFDVGSHAAVKSEVLEDIALGKLFAEHGIPVRSHNGGNSISFQMYSQGILSLSSGWIMGAPDAFLVWISYLAVWLELRFLAAKTGRFDRFLVFCFFIPLFFFHIIFFVSTIARGVFGKVVWKGRVIDLRKRR